MPTAARLPSPTLSMISRGPKAQSPPANTPGAEVIRVSRFTLISPRGEIWTPSSGCRKSRFGAWPMARMTVSHSNWRFAVLVERGIEAPVLVETAFGLQTSRGRRLCRRGRGRASDPKPGCMMMPSVSASSISSSAAGISSRVFQADEADFARAHAQRGERDVHHFVRGHGLRRFRR